MKRNEYCNIASYKELCVARRENCHALKQIRNDIPKHTAAFTESLLPEVWFGNLKRYVSLIISLI